MPAVTNSTYTYTPQQRGVFTPDNTSREVKKPQPAPKNAPKTKPVVIKR